MKIVFFGASVTQQSSNQANQITGYVPNTIKYLKTLLPTHNLEYKQMGYGSCSFNDAGLIYSSEVVEKNPDIVIMDWHTTWLSRFDDSSYRFVIESILSHYERTTLKAITPQLSFERTDLRRLDLHLKLSTSLPEKDIPTQHADLFNSTPKKAVFNDNLYCIGANIQAVY